MAITAATPIVTIWTGDTSPVLTFTVNKNDGTGALDVTGASANCYLRLMGGTANAFGSTTATIIDGPTGRIDYTIPAGGFTDPGVYYGQLKITLSGGGVQRPQQFQVNVDAGLS
jgi:hypothetical protein